MRFKYVVSISASAFLIFGCSSNKAKAPEAAPLAPTTTMVDVKPPVNSKVTAVSSTKILCTSGDLKRTIDIENSTPAGCRLLYSNFSEKDAVAWSFKGLTHCEKVRDQIRGTLEAAGFKCETAQ